jgi:hypothetical protein
MLTSELKPSEPAAQARAVGDYFLKKYRERAATAGVQTVARQLKKQGVAPEIAVLILAVRPC